MAPLEQNEVEESISQAEIVVTGRLVDASNASLFGHVFSKIDGSKIPIIYKPIAGERPLWDFPDGDLASREVAAFRINRMMQLDLVPFTILREGPYGLGSVQQWIEIDETFDLVAFAQSRDHALREVALFDVVINNTDRKIGHLLMTRYGKLFGIDHGVALHAENKLRTVLWQWRGEPLSSEEKLRLNEFISHRSECVKELSELLTDQEIVALFSRVSLLLENSVFPEPSGEWPAIPWPPI